MVWDTVQDFSISEIIVDQGTFGSSDPWTVIDSIAKFATELSEFGGVNAREMPPEVLWSSQVTYYQSQVSMNGHFDFVCNSRWKGSNVEACRKGLVACRANEYLQIFDELVEQVKVSGIPGAEWNERSGELKARLSLRDRISNLDTRYYALGEEKLLKARIAWLRSLPNLRAVPASALRPIIEDMTAGNPLRVPRLAILEKERAEARKEYAREQNTRFLIDNKVMEMGEQMLARLCRPCSNDPKQLAPIYEIIAGQGIAWPVDPDCNIDAYLMLMPTAGTAALIIDFESVGKPMAMPDCLCAYAMAEFEKAVSY